MSFHSILSQMNGIFLSWTDAMWRFMLAFWLKLLCIKKITLEFCFLMNWCIMCFHFALWRTAQVTNFTFNDFFFSYINKHHVQFYYSFENTCNYEFHKCVASFVHGLFLHAFSCYPFRQSCNQKLHIERRQFQKMF